VASFTSEGRVYELTSIDEVTPRDLLTFPRDASAVMGRPIRWSDIERIADEISKLKESEQETHPDFDFLLTVMIWVSRRAAGDRITYGECLDVPFTIDFEDDAGKAPAAKKAAKKPAKGKRQSGNPAVRAAAK
jgi:hypothetical protein